MLCSCDGRELFNDDADGERFAGDAEGLAGDFGGANGFLPDSFDDFAAGDCGGGCESSASARGSRVKHLEQNAKYK